MKVQDETKIDFMVIRTRLNSIIKLNVSYVNNRILVFAKTDLRDFPIPFMIFINSILVALLPEGN